MCMCFNVDVLLCTGDHFDPDASPAKDAPIGRRSAAVHLRSRRLDGHGYGGRLHGLGLWPRADPLGSWAHSSPDAGTCRLATSKRLLEQE